MRKERLLVNMVAEGVGGTREGRARGPWKEAGRQGRGLSSSGSPWWQGLERQRKREGKGRGREGGHRTSRADRHISGSSPPPKAWISLSFCQKLSGSLVVKMGPNPGQGKGRSDEWGR